MLHWTLFALFLGDSGKWKGILLAFSEIRLVNLLSAAATEEINDTRLKSLLAVFQVGNPRYVVHPVDATATILKVENKLVGVLRPNQLVVA